MGGCNSLIIRRLWDMLRSVSGPDRARLELGVFYRVQLRPRSRSVMIDPGITGAYTPTREKADW